MGGKRIIGIDPGATCGIVVLDGDTIVSACNIIYIMLSKFSHFFLHPDCTVVIEDIKPYSLRLTPQVIDTCKLIGTIEYRLRNECGVNVELVSRNEVKKWVFDRFNEIALPLVSKRMDKNIFPCCDIKTKELRWRDNNNRPKRKESFVYVNDKIVTEAMKFHYKIPTPAPGKGYQFGLKDHSWQALATASYFRHMVQK